MALLDRPELDTEDDRLILRELLDQARARVRAMLGETQAEGRRPGRRRAAPGTARRDDRRRASAEGPQHDRYAEPCGSREGSGIPARPPDRCGVTRAVDAQPERSGHRGQGIGSHGGLVCRRPQGVRRGIAVRERQRSPATRRAPGWSAGSGARGLDANGRRVSAPIRGPPECGAAAALARGNRGHDQKVCRAVSSLGRAHRAGHADSRGRQPARHRRSGQDEHPDQRRHRQRQDHAAQRCGVLYSRSAGANYYRRRNAGALGVFSFARL